MSNAPRQPAQLLEASVGGDAPMHAPSRHHALDSNADRQTGARVTPSSSLPRTLPRTAGATWAWPATTADVACQAVRIYAQLRELHVLVKDLVRQLLDEVVVQITAMAGDQENHRAHVHVRACTE